MDKRLYQFLLTVIVYSFCLVVFILGSKYLSLHFEDYSEEVLMLGRIFCVVSSVSALAVVLHIYVDIFKIVDTE